MIVWIDDNNDKELSEVGDADICLVIMMVMILNDDRLSSDGWRMVRLVLLVFSFSSSCSYLSFGFRFSSGHGQSSINPLGRIDRYRPTLPPDR